MKTIYRKQLFQICLVVFCAVMPPAMPRARAAVLTPALVQSASHLNGTMDSPTCAAIFPTNNTAGNLIVVAVTVGSSASQDQPFVTDTQGNTYYPATPQVTWRTTGGGTSAQIFYAPNIRGGSNIVTMTEGAPGVNGAEDGAGNAFNVIIIHEYSGIALASPLDVSSVANGITDDGPAAISSGSATTSKDGELIFGYANIYRGNLSAGPGFTLRQSPDGASEDMVQTTAGPIAAVEIDSNLGSFFGMMMAAFRPEVTSPGLELPFQTNRPVIEQNPLAVANAAAELNAAATSTQTTLFTYTNRAALLADGWSFIGTNPNGTPRNTEATNEPGVILYAQTNATFGTVMRVPCDVGDLFGPINTTTNSLFRPLSTNWLSMRMSMSLAPTLDFQQGHVGVYQDDDNYIDVGLASNVGLGGEAITFVAETNGVPHHYWTTVFWYSGGPQNPLVTNIFLRMDRDPGSGNLSGFASLDGVYWAFVGEFPSPLVNPRLLVWVGGSPVLYTNGLAVCDIREVDVITGSPPPAITYQLLNPPAGASIESNGIINWTPTMAQVGTNYTLTTVATDSTAGLQATNGFGVLVQAPMTVTGITADSRTYDGTTNATLETSGAALAGVLAGDAGQVTLDADGGTGGFGDPNAGTNKPVTVSGLALSGAAAFKYSLAQPMTAANITARPLMITADNKGKTAGLTNPPLTATYTGFVAGEDTNVLTSQVNLMTTAVTGSPAGPYPITAGGAAAANYVIAYVNGTLSVVAPPALSSANLAGNQFAAGIQTVAGETYQLQYKDNLTDTNWSLLPSVLGNGGLLTLTNTITGPQRFYRLIIQP